MDKFWKVSSSLKTFSGISTKLSVSPARKMKYLPKPRRYLLLCSQKKHKNNFVKNFNTPTPKTNESPSPTNLKLYFKPKTKTYLELSESPTPYDLRSRNLQKDINSAQKLLNYSEMKEKNQKAKKDFKVLTKKDIKKVEIEREDLHELELEIKKTHIKSSEFFKAIKDGDDKKLINLLKEFPELVRECDSTGQTGLHWAARRRLYKVAEILIRAGTNIMAKDMVGRRAEDIARKKKFADVSEILIAARRRTANVSKIFIGEKTNLNSFLNLRNMKVRKPAMNLNETIQ